MQRSSKNPWRKLWGVSCGGSVARRRGRDELHDDGIHLAAMVTAAVGTRAQEWSTYMEAWKANCATLDEKVTAVAKQLDEKVVAVTKQLAVKGGHRREAGGQLEGRLDTEIEQLNDELAGLEGAGSSMRSVESRCTETMKGHQN